MVTDPGEGNLGGVEEPGCVSSIDCVDEYSVGDAGDKAADVFLSGERRHGFAEGLVGILSGVVGFLSFFECRVVGAFPRGAGADNGGVLGNGGGGVFGDEA